MARGFSPAAIQTALRKATAWREADPPHGLPRRAARAMTQSGSGPRCGIEAKHGEADLRTRERLRAVCMILAHPVSGLPGESHPASGAATRCPFKRGIYVSFCRRMPALPCMDGRGARLVRRRRLSWKTMKSVTQTGKAAKSVS
jgi:hypothetical protein